MPSYVKIQIGDTSLRAEFFDTPCAKKIIDKLPIETVPNEWGDEFYFEIPVKAELDQTATTKVKAGDIGFWPPGNALAIFFGPTPMSNNSDPVPASAVNLVGKILDDAAILRHEKGSGKKISISKSKQGEGKMISRIDHVSIAVKDHEKAEHFFKDILGAIAGSCGGGIHANYFWQLYSMGDLSRLELISPTAKGSFLDGFLADKKDGGVHHITLQTPDIRKAMAHLEAHGIPFFGYNEYQDCLWKEIYIHPRNAFGVLIQISEFEADFWLSDQVKFPAGTKWEIEKTQNGAMLKFAHPGGGKVALELNRTELKQLMEKLKDAL